MNIDGNYQDDEACEEVAKSPGCEAGIDPDCGTESRDVNKEEMVAGAGFEGEKTILPAIFVTDFLFTSYWLDTAQRTATPPVADWQILAN